jgi:flagellar hook protein FlgE
MITADGQPVQGYSAIDPLTGKIDTSGPPSDIIVPLGVLRAPVATTSFGTVINLDASAQVGDTFGTSVQIYDALGVTHVATTTFTNTAPGKWDYKVTVPGEEVSTGPAGTPFSIKTGSVAFDSQGRLALVDAATAADVSITSPAWANGAQATNFTWDVVNSNGTPSITGFSSPSATASVTQNGSPSRSPSSIIVIDQNGNLLASSGVGSTVVVGQLALATFNNPEGLVKTGTNLFSESEFSGVAVIGTPGTGSRGTLIGSSLEQSNVDIAREFTQMILAQRGYQASSKGITVADELLVDTLNIIR